MPPSELKNRAERLMKRKEDLEDEMEGNFGILEMHNVTMNTPLVDAQGFPRGDIDVHAIRIARTSLIRLRNDHRQVVDDLQAVLEEIYARGGELPAPSERARRDAEGRSASGGGSGSRDREGKRRVMARVNMVASRSPAEQAGLRQHDRIVQFGSMEAPSGLKDIAELVGRSEGIEINLIVIRQDSARDASEQEVRLTLTPRSGWGGRGTLGCHILPP